jgi:hypothetical protein
MRCRDACNMLTHVPEVAHEVARAASHGVCHCAHGKPHAHTLYVSAGLLLAVPWSEAGVFLDHTCGLAQANRPCYDCTARAGISCHHVRTPEPTSSAPTGMPTPACHEMT